MIAGFALEFIRSMYKDNKELNETLDEQVELQAAQELAQEVENTQTYRPAPSYPTPSPYKKYW